MSSTHALILSRYGQPVSVSRPCSPPSSRPALADSTNVNSRVVAFDPVYPKRFAYPTSSTRTGCTRNDFESSVGSVPASLHPLHHHSSAAPSPFPVTYKAPPTVSVSLSAACSQSILAAERLGHSSVQAMEPELLDVRNVVPFPSTPLPGDMDVEMLDGTCVPYPDSHSSSAGQALRKRRSAHASISFSRSGQAKDPKQKRPRKSRRQVTELWWLGVVHRSILRCIEARQPLDDAGSPDRPPCDLDAMDRVLVDRIQKRLADNGCGEGRALPNPLPRISSPSMSGPSLNLSAPSRKSLPLDSVVSSESSRNDTFGGTTILSSSSNAPPCTPLSITSRSSIPSSALTSYRRHIRFDIPRQTSQLRSQIRPSIPRRSPSPPARAGTVSANAQTLTLTMPQLVASLTFAHYERSSLRLRGRPHKVTGCGKNAGPSLSPVPVPCSLSDRDAEHAKERMHQSSTLRAKLSSAPKRRSPLSRVAYAES